MFDLLGDALPKEEPTIKVIPGRDIDRKGRVKEVLIVYGHVRMRYTYDRKRRPWRLIMLEYDDLGIPTDLPEHISREMQRRAQFILQKVSQKTEFERGGQLRLI